MTAGVWGSLPLSVEVVGKLEVVTTGETCNKASSREGSRSSVHHTREVERSHDGCGDPGRGGGGGVVERKCLGKCGQGVSM